MEADFAAAEMGGAAEGGGGGGGCGDWFRHWRTEAEQSQYYEVNEGTWCELQTWLDEL